ncbi:hypothetical protein L2U69_09400 [Zavarzinia compransoris]|uniref:hypothetical protein n=1 Tax=Zavarzinia marina TaxID=2911065 RepID=UPI001F2D9844|nr:hypothetical protein [Zavarzinia marina]MCF4165856.1 hypothetical protein [Zavarzinia marina]
MSINMDEMEEKPKVLVIDGDADRRSVLLHYISSWGFEVEGAYDGYSGMRCVLHGRPDVIVVDGGLRGWAPARVIDGVARLGSRAKVIMLNEPALSTVERKGPRRVFGVVGDDMPFSSMRQLIAAALDRRAPQPAASRMQAL